jgi:hypothetical protein
MRSAVLPLIAFFDSVLVDKWHHHGVNMIAIPFAGRIVG